MWYSGAMFPVTKFEILLGYTAITFVQSQGLRNFKYNIYHETANVYKQP